MKTRSFLRILLFTGVLFCGFSGGADAQSIIRYPHEGPRPFVLDAPIVSFGYAGLGAAAGVRFGIPILSNGFVPSINNAVYINFGVDLYFFSFLNDGSGAVAIAMGFPVALHWGFYFTPRWSAFAELGVNIYLNSALFNGGGFLFNPGSLLYTAVGGRFHISRSFALVLRLGFPYASFGLSWSF